MLLSMHSAFTIKARLNVAANRACGDKSDFKATDACLSEVCGREGAVGVDGSCTAGEACLSVCGREEAMEEGTSVSGEACLSSTGDRGGTPNADGT